MADYTTLENDSIILGSGELYLALVSETEGKSETEIDALLHKVGAISGGASVEYKPENKAIKPANRAKINFKTDEISTFKTGILNFTYENLSYVAPVEVTTNAEGTKRVKVGGTASTPNVYLKFEHEEKDGSKLILRMSNCVCTNGFKFDIDPENPTVVDFSFESNTSMTNAGALTIDFVPAPTTP